MNVCHSDSNSILSLVFSSPTIVTSTVLPVFSVCAHCHFAFAHCGSFHFFSLPVSPCHLDKRLNIKRKNCLPLSKAIFHRFLFSQTFKYHIHSGQQKSGCFSHINENAWCLYVWSLHESCSFCGLYSRNRNRMQTAGNIHHFISSCR